MKPTRLLLLASLALAAVAASRTAPAAENPLDFVHALSDGGYADIAIEYLESLKTSRDLPPGALDAWDLEMSRALRAASKQAYDAKEAKRLIDEAQKYLDKFIKEKPNHPEAISAMVAVAGFLTDKAMEELRASKDPRLAKDPEELKKRQAEHLKAAREAFTEAKPVFMAAAKKFEEQLLKLPKAPRPPRKDPSARVRADLKYKWMDAWFQAALCDYYVAQSSDPKDPDRRKNLQEASKEFDKIFQKERGSERSNDIAIYAHMWQGKTEQELENFELAKEIYDEVLTVFPDKDSKEELPPFLQSLLTQVKRFSLEIVAKQTPKSFLVEARQFRADYHRMELTDGYQGISMDLAKALLAAADKAASAADKGKLTTEAKDILRKMSRTPSQSQQEATALMRQLSGGNAAEPTTFEEAISQGDTAATNSEPKWDEAIVYYVKALEFGENLKGKQKPDPALIAKIKDKVAECFFMIAREHFNKGKLDESLDAVKTIVTKYRDAAIAPTAASLGVTILLNKYLALPGNNAAKQKEALDRVIKLAKFTIETWPARPEADEAHMMLGQAFIVTDQIDKAMAEFENVNPKSERYATALYLEGRPYWRRYVLEKMKPDEQRNQQQMAGDREKAVKALDASVKLMRKAAPADQPLPKPLVEAQLLYAEMLLEGEDFKAAAPLYQSLVDDVKKYQKLESLDEQTLRIFLGAVRTYLGANDLNKAAEVGVVLIDKGPDVLKVNNALLGFAKLVDAERRKAAAIADSMVSDADVASAKRRLASLQEVEGKLLTKLAGREKVSASGMVWIAETSLAVGLDSAAEKQCNQFLARIDPKDKNYDEDFAIKQGGAKAEPHVRTILIAVLTNKGAFEKASEQCKALVNAHPKSLEPRLQKCRVYQAWGQKDSTKFPLAVQEWDTLRRSLERAKDPKKTAQKIPEYYEAAYSEAVCIYEQAKKLDKQGNKPDAATTAKKGEDILKSILFNRPKLDGYEDMLIRYNGLVDKFELLQGRTPASKKPDAGAKGGPTEKK